MKIYSVYEYGGKYEDRYECIMGSFISEEKALEFKQKLEEKQDDYFFDEFSGYDISSIEINDADDYDIVRRG